MTIKASSKIESITFNLRGYLMCIYGNISNKNTLLNCCIFGLGLVVFCIIFGIFISHAKKEAQILYDFFFSLNELIMKIVAVIMW